MSNLLQTIENDLKTIWVDAEHFVVGEAEILWDDFKAILNSTLPSQYIILRNFVLQVLPEISTGNIADIETAILNLAVVQELDWVKNLGSTMLQAIIALVTASITHVPSSVPNSANSVAK